MTPRRSPLTFSSTLAVVWMLGGVGGGGWATAAEPTALSRPAAPTTLSHGERVQKAPDPASVFEGPKVDDASDAKTGGSFGEPGMRQRAERTPMRAFAESIRSLREPSVTIGETTHATPQELRLTDEQLASATRIQREYQAAAARAAREAGVSMEDMRALRDDSADPEQRRAMLEKVEAVTPDPTVAQEKILALLSEEQRRIVEERIELWRADRYARARGAALQKQEAQRAAEQDARRAQNPQNLARLARALGVSEATAAKVRDAISGPPAPGEEGLTRLELAERRIEEIPGDVLNASQRDRLKQMMKRRLEREGAPRQD